ncbi:MAG TPA: PEP-CTERM sorting domain-containing protein, partial [Opitutales bacterium]|nr:PEP-CTERM sorting domain-containing protein [Opitutales bacterium]
MKTKSLVLSAAMILPLLAVNSARAEYLTNEGWDWGVDERGTGGSTAYTTNVSLTAQASLNATNTFAWDMIAANDSIGWDLDHNGFADLVLFNSEVSGSGVQFVNNGTGSAAGSFLSQTSGSTTIDTVDLGTTIGSSGWYSVSSTATLMSAAGFIGNGNTALSNVEGAIVTGDTVYLAFTFESYLGSANPTTTYGWLSLTANTGDGSKELRIIELGKWAYGTTGESVLVGVPEPSTYAAGIGLLALGAAGVRRWRKG